MKVELYGENWKKLDADIYEEQIGSWTEYIIESRGGTRGSKNQRNPDYLDALEKLLALLGDEGCQVRDILLASRQAVNRPADERRVRLAGRPFPINLDKEDPSVLKGQITRAAAGLMRKPGAKGPGNFTRRLQLIVSKDVHRNFVNNEIKHNVLPNQGSIIDRRRGSGPLPSSSRAAVDRMLAEGFTYALVLHGAEMPAIKIGFTSNVERRIGTLNREIRPTLTKCKWALLKSWRFDSEGKAYEFEQDLLWLFRKNLVSGEREIVSVTQNQFLQTVDDYVAKQTRENISA